MNPKEVQEYLTYICDTVLRDTLGVISKDAVDTSDPTYLAWTDGSEYQPQRII